MVRHGQHCVKGQMGWNLRGIRLRVAEEFRFGTLREGHGVLDSGEIHDIIRYSSNMSNGLPDSKRRDSDDTRHSAEWSGVRNSGERVVCRARAGSGLASPCV